MIHQLQARIRKSAFLTTGLAVALLVSCGSTPLQNAAQPKTFAYVQTVNISSNDTTSSIESQYQGTVVSWQPEAGFAIVGSDQLPASTVETSSVTSTTGDTNTAIFAIAEGSKAMAGGSKAMAGGSKAMAGGIINAFAQEASEWGNGWTDNTITAGNLNVSYQNLNAFVANPLYMLSFTGGEKGGIRLASAQGLALKLGADVKVAVIDTGVDLEHPGLKGVAGDPDQAPHLTPASDWADFVDGDSIPQEVVGEGFGHGTAVAGVLSQIAPGVKIMPIRVLGADGSGDVTNVVKGIDWAVKHGAKIINLSLGADVPVTSVRKMIAWASSKGVFVVASAGNTDDTKVTYPAADAQNDAYGGKRLISVGSVGSGNIAAALLGFTNVAPTKLDLKSVFSTYGNVEMYAPGELIATLAPNLKAAVWTGTSFAAPMVSGTLALALGQPLNGSQLERVADAITTTATPIDVLNTLLTGKLGKGRLDAAAFMRKVLY
jgi:thermitase